MNVTISKADSKDFPAIFSLIKEFSIFQQTPQKVTITLEQMMEDENIFKCFVAETADKNIVGFATFFFSYHSWTGKSLYVDDLYVTEAFRKQGIGERLLNTLINLGKDNCCKKVRWQVSKWNTDAIGFYKKMGAVIDDTDINCDLTIKGN